jgi:glycosyltransferase involved in cell wall biosynthesis
MLNVLLSAYACNPKRGSEEAVGWNWTQAIARRHRVTALTAAFHERDIREACDPSANPRFIFVPHRPWHYAPTPGWRRIENSIAKPIMNLAYASWQQQAFSVARALAACQHFDLVHQLTYVGFRFPGHLYKLGLPFVWGPVGGLENVPWRLLPSIGARGLIEYAGRNVINSAQQRFLRSPRRAAVVAGPGLIAATDRIAEALLALYGVPATVITEVVAPVELSPRSPPSRRLGDPLRLVWSGLHLPRKALPLLLHALARMPAQAPVELHILGDGPMRAEWRGVAARLGVDGRCVWRGQLARSEALRLMSGGHALVLTSLMDLTSTVLLEALALGLPVVCPDRCGFSSVVTETCGIKLPAPSTAAFVSGLTDALMRLCSDEALRFRLGHGALARAREFSAGGLATRVDAVYARVLDQAGHAALQ